MLFRLRCHFCGARSRYSRGTTEFQCQSCEAWNFRDRNGDVADTPARVAAAPKSQPAPVTPSRAFAKPGSRPTNISPQDSNPSFCQTCLTNQRIYTESLANYLPDEDHPQYAEYERKLPAYKADLERRYPQICKNCAPKAQATISRADRYGLQQNVAKNMKDTSARRGRSNKGRRDDWGKWGMRRLLAMVGWMLYAGLLAQLAWHAYSMFTTAFSQQETVLDNVDSLDVDELAFDPTLTTCARDALRLRFYRPCAGLLSSVVPKSLLASLVLFWYNPGIALWYHHTIRIEAVHGRSQHYFMQLILLAMRGFAWLNLTNAQVAFGLTKPQLLAAHGFMAVFIPLLQRYSERVIRYDVWRIRGRMMQSPDEMDAFGAHAGPGRDTSPGQASSVPPVRLFERSNRPFLIESLAPRATRSNAGRGLPYQPPPSPPDSQSHSDDEMEYQMDWQPSKPQVTAPAHANDNYNYGMTAHSKGWTPMRNELFGIQSQQSAAEQQRQEEAEQARLHEQELQHRSPFRGTLPPDPMQRRLRSAQPQLQKKQQPLSEQPDFYQQMSKSFGSQRFGAKTPTKIGNLERRAAAASTAKKNVSFADGFGAGGLSLNDDDEDFSPVKSRSRSHSRSDKKQMPSSGSGSLNFRESQWRLPDKTEATGLEDLFGGHSFRIADEAPTGGVAESVRTWPLGKMLLCALPALILAVCWNVEPLRRAVCLWLVERLEGMGY